MDETQHAELINCPHCGARRPDSSEGCWLCGTNPPDPGALVPSPPTQAAPVPFRATLHQDRTARSFGLSTLFLFITLVAVCLGLGMAAPGLGVLLAVLSVPAFFRASAWATREEAAGRRTDAADRFGRFLGSLGLIFVIALAGCVAFLAACWVSCVVAGGAHGDSAVVLINLIAGSLAIALVGWLLWKTWPRRGKPRR